MQLINKEEGFIAELLPTEGLDLNQVDLDRDTPSQLKIFLIRLRHPKKVLCDMFLGLILLIMIGSALYTINFINNLEYQG